MSVMRYLTYSQVAALGGNDPLSAFDDVVETVKLLHSGEASMPAETHVDLTSPQGKVYSLPATVGGRFNAAGVKWTAHRPQARDGYPMAMAMTLLNRADNGLPVAIMQSGSLTATRTAAVSALALRYASPKPPRRILLLGAGVQAAAHLKMLAAHFPGLEKIYCWNRTPSHLEAMLNQAETLPWQTEKLTSIEYALAQPWDALITCTSASQPFIGQQFIQPGRMVMQIGYHEVSFEAIARADKVVVDGWGDYCNTSAKSLFQMYRAGEFVVDSVAADLNDLVVNNWRASPTDSVYFSSFGLNVFDIALAARVAQEAERQDVGTALPLEFALS